MDMVGQPDETNLGSTDWVKNATPENLTSQGAAIFGKIGSMDVTTQDRFVQQLKANPNASRLFERIGSATA
jgi:hypothetical protein